MENQLKIARKSGVRFLSLAGGSLLLLSGCDPLALIGDGPISVPDNPPLDIYDPRVLDPAWGLSEAELIEAFSDASCNAFFEEISDPINRDYGSQSPNLYRQGVYGQIYTPPVGFNPTDWRTLDKFVNEGQRVRGSLFLDSLNVPTRPFDEGFKTFNGNFLKNAMGEKLMEWFHIKFRGFIKVDPVEDGFGEYEFAILADDGARLYLGADRQKVIDQPAVTPTKMMCGEQTTNLFADTKLPFELQYFQGPRYHIAVNLMWRKIDPAVGRQVEPLCNASGNSKFWDSTKTPSEPKQAFIDLQNRGWKVVPPSRFSLPDGYTFNPCFSDRVREFFDELRARRDAEGSS